MDIQKNTTGQKLFGALMQFKRAEWHQRSVEGYKPSEIRVLFCVKKGMGSGVHEMKVSEISKRLHVTPPTITQLIKSLEASGLVERNVDQVDRRTVGIKLTEKGEKVTDVAANHLFASINGLIKYMGEEESDQFAELLVKASRYFNEQAASMENVYWNGEEEL